VLGFPITRFGIGSAPAILSRKQPTAICAAPSAVLEDAGVRFSDGGVYLQRTAPIGTTVLHSEGAPA